MPRYKLIIEYDGAPFVGWQRQANGLSVQEAIESALFSLSGETVAIRSAGRTDAGVHAKGQVAHADLSKAWRPDVLRDALNAWLRPRPSRSFPPSASRLLSMRASPPCGGTISIASPIAARL